MAIAQRIDFNHDAVLGANPLHELGGAEFVWPRRDFKVPGRLVHNAAGSIGIPDETIDPPFRYA